LLEESKDDIPKGFSKRNVHLDSRDINTFDLLRSIDSVRMSKTEATGPHSNFITIAENYVAPAESDFNNIKDINPLDSKILEKGISTPSRNSSMYDEPKGRRYSKEDTLQEESEVKIRPTGFLRHDDSDTCIVDASLAGPFSGRKNPVDPILKDVTNTYSPIRSPASNKNIGSPLGYNQDSMSDFTNNLNNKLTKHSTRNEKILNSEMKNPLEESDVDIKDSHPGSPVIYKTSKTLQTTISNGGKPSYNMLDDDL
jgi:hypothetical protein